jgi:anti-sigma regulatory factor (Ser/Thr protein kinase)/ABC-type transporter Mla MlaB component
MALGIAPLSLSLESNGKQPSLIVSGHVDETNIDRLVTVLDHLAEEHERCVSLDLAEVPSIDATALECLAESAGTFSGRRRRLHIKDASDAVQQSLDRHLLMDIFCCEAECAGHACEIAARVCHMDLFTLPSEPACCSEARNRVKQVAESAGLVGNWLRDVMVAVGEAVSNAIRHGSVGADNGSFTVSCIANPERISISVSDSGPGFCIEDVPTFEDALFREHGRGIHCMNALMDEVSFSFEGGTSVRLVKRAE